MGEDQQEVDAEVAVSSAVLRDHVQEWQRLMHREDVNDERGVRLSAREADQVRRKRVADQRDQLADDRDRTADQRDQVADGRDRTADRRDRAADERDRLSDVRDGVADQREIDAEVRPGSSDPQLG